MQVVVREDKSEGMLSLMDQVITVWCDSYIYTGRLVGINDQCIKLDDASVVYETGPLTSKEWTDAQKLPGAWYIQLGKIESFGVLK